MEDKSSQRDNGESEGQKQILHILKKLIFQLLFFFFKNVFIMLPIPREKVNKDRRHFAAVTGTKMIDIRHGSRILLTGLVSHLLF